MGVFYIDTSSGHVATQRQLHAAGIGSALEAPPRPWLRIQAGSDASTMWFAVLRKRERGIFIGALVFRHSTHHSSLLARGWEEIPISEISAPA